MIASIAIQATLSRRVLAEKGRSEPDLPVFHEYNLAAFFLTRISHHL
jgi:hypothetical protein